MFNKFCVGRIQKSLSIRFYIIFNFLTLNVVIIKAMNLLRKMLAENPSFRPTAQEALCDEFLKSPNPQKIEDMKMIENFASFRTEYEFSFILSYYLINYRK